MSLWLRMTYRWEATAVSGALWATWPWVMWCDSLSLRCRWPVVRLQWHGLAGAAVAALRLCHCIWQNIYIEYKPLKLLPWGRIISIFRSIQMVDLLKDLLYIVIQSFAFHYIGCLVIEKRAALLGLYEFLWCPCMFLENVLLSFNLGDIALNISGLWTCRSKD